MDAQSSMMARERQEGEKNVYLLAMIQLRKSYYA